MLYTEFQFYIIYIHSQKTKNAKKYTNVLSVVFRDYFWL